MIQIRHYAHKPKGCATYKVKFFRREIDPNSPEAKRPKYRYWMQRNTVHRDWEAADRQGRRWVTELELQEHNKLLGVTVIAKKPLAEVVRAHLVHGSRKGGRRRNPWSARYAANTETALTWWLTSTGWKRLEDINLAEAEEALERKMGPTGAPIGGSHKNNLVSHLQGLIGFAHSASSGKEPLAPKGWDPLSDWEPYNDDPDKLHRDFTLDEFRVLMRESESREERAAYLIAAATRARFSALKGLKVYDADFPGSMVRIARRAEGNKAKKEVWKKVPRWIMDEIENQARGRDQDDALLLGLVGHLGAKTVQKRLRAGGVTVRTAKGVLTFHSLKVTGVNLLWDTGTDVRTVQALSDHSTADLSTRVYGREREGREWAATDQIGEWLRSAVSHNRDTSISQKEVNPVSKDAYSEENVGSNPTASEANPPAPPVGIPGHPRASLIPFKINGGRRSRRGASASLGIPEPETETHMSHKLAGQLAELWPRLTVEAQQSIVNHARGWFIGLLPNKARKAGAA
jgi:integrase